MPEESVKNTLVFKYFGQTLLADIGDEGSVRFRIGDFNVQLSATDFERLAAAQKNAHRPQTKEMVISVEETYDFGTWIGCYTRCKNPEAGGGGKTLKAALIDLAKSLDEPKTPNHER